MIIWVVNPYGTLPSEGWREYRSSMLVKSLAERGHRVTWWISDFIHRNKTYRRSGYLFEIGLPPSVKIISVHSRSYKKNVSIKRILYEKSFGNNFLHLAKYEELPDVIVLADPSIFYSKPVLEFKKKSECKLILDIIDLWPELFIVTLPKFLKALHGLIFYTLYSRREKTLQQCDGIVAVSKDYLSIAAKQKFHLIPKKIVYLGVDTFSFRKGENNPSLDIRLTKFRSKFDLIATYAGTLGDAYDIGIIIQAVNYAVINKLSIGFIVAGEGAKRNQFIQLQEKCAENIIFLDSVGPSELKTIYQNSDVGIMSYIPGSTVSMPTKFYDYLVGGLAILNSLGREVGDIVLTRHVGLNYSPSNFQDFIAKLIEFKDNKEKLFVYKKNSSKLAEEYQSSLQYASFSAFIEEIVA